ncbi:Beta-hexosaminidase [Arcticibacter svalbardensis MN12-7]|uniref:beta-N-acetylhexosaminidase n=1 Tax=Arcticibacter svalbardensis MN12-7 TaxID=1150600 RepID=R9GXV3_9SPHI|nr:beta-N-acetylhexosaminidase [Arcticibacter svalbardensis]EOR96335.1 Beta-hexosaminidase [Arcticibacter svalbardensis MN12-7]
MFKRTFILILLYAFTCSSYAQISIIPKPSSMISPANGGTVRVDASTQISVQSPALQNSADFLNDYLVQFYGFMLKSKMSVSNQAVVYLSIKNEASKSSGSYSLVVNKNGINILGNDATGVFYGVQSLIQLLPVVKEAVLSIPYVTINDAPHFAYRGMHLDVTRHFFPVAFVKKYIDFLALHKMNYFHWHLTDDQGWRIEIKKYPRLTQIGGYRNGTIIGHFPGTGNDNKHYGGFYTQEQIKEVVAYATKRYITVVPEIEMPGHASAAIAAYPELSCFPEESTKAPEKTVWSGPATGKQVQQTWGVFEDVFAPTENTFTFLQDVLDEVISLFPSQYIHIGGDESPKHNWKRSAFCQQLIKEKGLKDEHGLQSYFVQRMEKYVNSKGRTIIGWDEILEGGLAPNAIVMSWRGEEGGIAAAKLKHQVIMTPGSHVYFDHSQVKPDDSLTIGGYTTVRKVYSYEPIPKELSAEEGKYVLGAQANLWTEYLPYTTTIEYQIFPRISALSEVLWSSKESRQWEEFEPRLRNQMKRYDLWKVHYGAIDAGM